MKGCSLDTEKETKMTLPLELCGREKDADSKGTELLFATQLFFLLTTQLCFHYSYFMRYHGMKESYFLHGALQVMACSQVGWLITSWVRDGFSGFIHQNSQQ